MDLRDKFQEIWVKTRVTAFYNFLIHLQISSRVTKCRVSSVKVLKCYILKLLSPVRYCAYVCFITFNHNVKFFTTCIIEKSIKLCSKGCPLQIFLNFLWVTILSGQIPQGYSKCSSKLELRMTKLSFSPIHNLDR